MSFNFKFKPCLLRRRAELVMLKSIPTPHDFRRAFALIMLHNGVEIFAVQKLMEHSDLQVLRHYLAQTDEDVHTVHMRGSAPSISGKSYPGDSARIGHIK